MTKALHLAWMLILTFAMAGGVCAQSPREQLRQMVEQLQGNPSDTALRERIIRLVQEIKPAPAVPDTAIEFEGRAQFAFKNAKSEADYLAAAREYEKAVLAAPWVPGYYSDLCTIYEKAGKFEDAKRNCELSLLGLSESVQVTDVKRRIAGLQYGIERNSPSALAERAKEKERKFIESLNGGIWRGTPAHPDFDIFLEVRGREIEFDRVFKPGTQIAELNPHLVNRRGVIWKTTFDQREFLLNRDILRKGFTDDVTDVKLIISEDAQSITEEITGRRPYRVFYRRIN